MASITCVLVANSSIAKFFMSPNVSSQLTLEKTYEHPESRMKVQDLTSGPMGNYKARSGQGQGSFVEPVDHKNYEASLFAKELAEVLDEWRNNHSFDRLVVIAPSHFQGLLNQQCNDHIRHMVISTVDRDYTHLDERQLMSHLSDLPRY